jgi:hypothetical protein
MRIRALEMFTRQGWGPPLIILGGILMVQSQAMHSNSSG